MRTLILGVGSPYGDDQLGWLAIDLLKLYLKAQPTTVELAKVDRPGLNLLQLLDTTYPRII
ncbi:MAG: hypothetical protein ACK4M7_01730, partial [Burkholderiales bacterium]